MTEVGPPREFWISQWKLGSSETPIIRRAEAHDVKDQISGRRKRNAKKNTSSSSPSSSSPPLEQQQQQEQQEQQRRVQKRKTFNNIKLPKSSSVKASSGSVRSKRKRAVREDEEDEVSALHHQKKAAVEVTPPSPVSPTVATSIAHYPIVSEILLEPIPSLAEPLRPQPRPVMMPASSQYYRPNTNVSSMLNWNTNSYTPSSAIHRFIMQQPQFQFYPPYFGSRSPVDSSTMTPYPCYVPTSSVPLRNFNYPLNEEPSFFDSQSNCCFF